MSAQGEGLHPRPLPQLNYARVKGLPSELCHVQCAMGWLLRGAREVRGSRPRRVLTRPLGKDSGRGSGHGRPLPGSLDGASSRGQDGERCALPVWRLELVSVSGEANGQRVRRAWRAWGCGVVGRGSAFTAALNAPPVL